MSSRWCGGKIIVFDRFKARQSDKALLRNPVVDFALEEWDRRINDKDVA